MQELSNIQLQIKSTLEEYETLKKVNTHIDEIDKQLKTAYQKIKIMDGQLNKELKDIEELESLGVKSLFYKTLGNKEEQLEKERQDYLELSLHYNQFKKEIELMEYERNLLVKKLTNVKTIQQKLAELKELRKLEILSSPNSHMKDELQKLMHDLDINIALEREIVEAIIEGEKALTLLAKIVALLEKAEDWGRWDMYGNNRRAKYAKQQSIEKALRLIPSAQHQLNLFLRELKDLGENNVVIKLDTINFNKFKDFFFDNLISDWIIQQRIRNTLGNIEGTHSHVKRIVLSLQQESSAVKQKLVALKNQQEKMVLS